MDRTWYDGKTGNNGIKHIHNDDVMRRILPRLPERFESSNGETFTSYHLTAMIITLVKPDEMIYIGTRDDHNMTGLPTKNSGFTKDAKELFDNAIKNNNQDSYSAIGFETYYNLTKNPNERSLIQRQYDSMSNTSDSYLFIDDELRDTSASNTKRPEKGSRLSRRYRIILDTISGQ